METCMSWLPARSRLIFFSSMCTIDAYLRSATNKTVLRTEQNWVHLSFATLYHRCLGDTVKADQSSQLAGANILVPCGVTLWRQPPYAPNASRSCSNIGASKCVINSGQTPPYYRGVSSVTPPLLPPESVHGVSTREGERNRLSN